VGSVRAQPDLHDREQILGVDGLGDVVSGPGLRLGDTLLLFTDGLIERRDEPIDDAIANLLRAASRPVSEISGYADHLLDQAASNTDDDACLVAVRVR
jgi:Stage II sporulation protein E (SpoIIE)